MVFRKPTCSLPAVGGGGARGGGSVCTVTWHWKESRAGQHCFSPSTPPHRLRLEPPHSPDRPLARSPGRTGTRVPSNDSGFLMAGVPCTPTAPPQAGHTPPFWRPRTHLPPVSAQGLLTGPVGMSQQVSSSAWRESQ